MCRCGSDNIFSERTREEAAEAIQRYLEKHQDIYCILCGADLSLRDHYTECASQYRNGIVEGVGRS